MRKDLTSGPGRMSLQGLDLVRETHSAPQCLLGLTPRGSWAGQRKAETGSDQSTIPRTSQHKLWALILLDCLPSPCHWPGFTSRTGELSGLFWLLLPVSLQWFKEWFVKVRKQIFSRIFSFSWFHFDIGETQILKISTQLVAWVHKSLFSLTHHF